MSYVLGVLAYLALYAAAAAVMDAVSRPSRQKRMAPSKRIV